MYFQVNEGMERMVLFRFVDFVVEVGVNGR
jgi:hypothetical protein